MKKLMLGNEAIARGVYEAGVTVASAYPGTPSTEITENIATYDNIFSEWAPNEKVSMEVAVGASVAGARAVCSMKHVGLNVAADPLFTVSYSGVNGGLVIIVADDPGMHSSQNEQDSRYYAIASKVPMLEPSDSQECKDFVKKAFDISERFDTPVFVRLTTRVAHSQSVVELEEKTEYILKEYVKDVTKYVSMPSTAKKRRVIVEQRMGMIAEFSETTELNRIEWGRKDIGVITNGITYQYVKEALGDVSILKLGMVHPLPKNLIKEFAENIKTLYVAEELEPIIENQIKELGIKVIGKEEFPVIGELSVKKMKNVVLCENTEINHILEANVASLPPRPPVMCPGCPHRGLYFAFKKLKLTVMGDIGCYTLGAMQPLDSVDTCLCMGASIGMAHGFEKARNEDCRKKTVAVIGDSTFMHSGITGLIDVVYNKGATTLVIADNSTTGMTGHQHNPTTGFNIKNEPTNSVDLEALVRAIGIRRVKVVDPLNITELEETLKEELEINEPSVIITRRPCALLKSKAPRITCSVNSDICKNCKMCLKIGCPSMEYDGNVVRINEVSCSGCSLCTKICKANAIEKRGEGNV